MSVKCIIHPILMLVNNLSHIFMSIYSFLLYGYNIIIEPLNLYIPINFITVGALSILGVPALFCLIFILIFIY